MSFNYGNLDFYAPGQHNGMQGMISVRIIIYIMQIITKLMLIGRT